MSFTVLWTPRAEQQLAEIWLITGDRQAVNLAARTVDRLLRSTPMAQGESRYDSLRVMFARPLGIAFEVVGQDRVVYVMNVWSFA